MTVAWDPEKIGLTAGRLNEILLSGDPAIQTHAQGKGHAFQLRPVALKPEEYKIVAERLYQAFKDAPAPVPAALEKPAADLSGRWNVRVQFAMGQADHLLFLEAYGNRLTGTHIGTLKRGPLKGQIDGDQVSFESVLPIEGSRLSYEFTGKLSGNRMEGELDLGEYPPAKWTAVRDKGSEVPGDPSAAGKTA
jgi:L-seryl-tRNA(Ser) seleniumtransferase